MKKKLIILSFILLALAACSDNLFGSGSESGGDAKSLRIDAENAFRSGDYKKAYDICSKIVDLDSTASFGYFGMAKASLWDRGINPMEVLTIIQKNKEDENAIPFMDEPVKVKNQFLQGMRKIANSLSPLDRRDSLTRIHKLYKQNPLSADSSVIKFREAFNCQVDVCTDRASGKTLNFPLSDMEFNGDYFGPILFVATLTKSLLDVFDINKDNCIATRSGAALGVERDGNPDTTIANRNKWTEWGCTYDKYGGISYDVIISVSRNDDGTFSVDLDQLLEDLGLTEEFYEAQIADPNTPIPDGIRDVNDKLESFTGDLNEVIDMMEILGLGGSTDTDADPNEWKDDIEKYKGQSVFYRAGTRIDEDGDGCIEEDLLGQDNDGDGLKSGNARIAPTDPESPFFGRAGINHSMYGDDPTSPENVNHSRNLPIRLSATPPVYIRNYKDVDCSAHPEACTMLEGDSIGMVNVIGFTQEPGYWTSNDPDLKLKIAQDTICPPVYDLEYRKQNIGGCWGNYTEEKFVKYWLKRGLARPADREKRTHPSCNDNECRGIACLLPR